MDYRYANKIMVKKIFECNLRFTFDIRWIAFVPIRSDCLGDNTFATGTDSGQLIGSDFVSSLNFLALQTKQHLCFHIQLFTCKRRFLFQLILLYCRSPSLSGRSFSTDGTLSVCDVIDSEIPVTARGRQHTVREGHYGNYVCSSGLFHKGS